ncbi:MAG: hypothetical protein IK085_01715 [Clostridia bacterium]|nr:hypothetical protein [Clostridia bacterium]
MLKIESASNAFVPTMPLAEEIVPQTPHTTLIKINEADFCGMIVSS